MIDLDAQPPPEPMTEESRAPMSRASQISDRDRIEAYFRREFRAAGLAADAADTLAARAARRIKRMVVWDDAGSEPVTSRPRHDPAAQPTSLAAAEDEPGPAAATTTPPATPFDPYAFSAVVVLTKSGRDGLLKRLAAIDRPDHLRALAEAQRLAVDPALASPADLRAAIVAAAERRIANRRAAAS